MSLWTLLLLCCTLIPELVASLLAWTTPANSHWCGPQTTTKIASDSTLVVYRKYFLWLSPTPYLRGTLSNTVKPGRDDKLNVMQLLSCKDWEEGWTFDPVTICNWKRSRVNSIATTWSYHSEGWCVSDLWSPCGTRCFSLVFPRKTHSYSFSRSERLSVTTLSAALKHSHIPQIKLTY